MFERLLDGALRDLVKDDASELAFGSLGRALPSEFLREVPADRLTFAVRVGREEHFVRVLRRLLQLVDDLLAGGQNLVVDVETLLDVDTQFALGQVADVPHRGFYGVA